MRIGILTVALGLFLSVGSGAQERFAELMQEKLEGRGAAVLLDIREGVVLAASGRELLMGGGRPVGSLMKLFTTAALLAAGADGEEVYLCAPSSPEIPSTSACWYRPGHGNMTLRSALANSCNAYFRQWLEGKKLDCARALLTRLRLLQTEPPEEAMELSEALLGFSPVVRPRPVELACAAGALFNGGVLYAVSRGEAGERCPPVGTIRLPEETVAVLTDGMRESARFGTGRAVQEAVGIEPILAKTGTSAHWTGEGVDVLKTDGWCLVLHPADRPKVLLLVLVEFSSGAEDAAQAAGGIMCEYLKGLKE